MANLIFKGHATRGEELHKLLEYLGGIDSGYKTCSCVTSFYYINREGYIEGSSIIPDYMNHRMIMSLETFESNFPYKVGDKVNYVKYNDGHPSVYTIQRMRWTGVTIEYLLDSSGLSALTKDLQPYKEETMEKGIIYDEVGTNRHGYTTMMLNPYKEELIKLPILTPTLDLATEEILYFTDKTTNKKYYPNEPSDLSMECPDGFEFIDENGNVITSKKIKLERKKKQHPKTYEECCKVLLLNPEKATYSVCGLEYKRHLIVNFQRLLVCRDAYWKIEGNWTPNERTPEDYFFIVNKNGDIIKDRFLSFNHILAFPTEEMRDAFYDNFKELIESCKELL